MDGAVLMEFAWIWTLLKLVLLMRIAVCDWNVFLLILKAASPDDSGENCGFDAGAFVGGMFLVIGLLILAMIGYFVYVYKFGRKASYNQL